MREMRDTSETHTPDVRPADAAQGAGGADEVERTPQEWDALRAADAAEVARRDRLPVINHLAQIPAFASEAEEAAFWDGHEAEPGLEQEARRREREGTALPLPPVRARTQTAAKIPAPISVRLEADTLVRLRRLAGKKGTRYQTLLKQFIIERLYEEERREGLVG